MLLSELALKSADEELARQLEQRKGEYYAKPKSARGRQPPRMGRQKVVQKYLCPCYLLAGKDCPACKGKAIKIPDPDGPAGAMISSCKICQCNCACGPFTNSDREDLYNAYQDFLSQQREYSAVSEHRPSGIGDIDELALVAVQVSRHQLCFACDHCYTTN